jgi:restriction endonuclease S subunit
MDLLKETDVESGNREKGGAKTHGVMSLGGEHVGLDGNISLNNMKYVSPEFYKKANRGVLSTSDILICKDGALTGKVAIVKDGDIKGDAMINEHLFKISSSQKALNQYYLFYYLFLFEGQKQIKAGITGAAQGGLNRKNLFDIKIPLPPVEIQQRIIEKIKEIENEEKKEKQSLVEVSKKIIDLFNSGEKVKVSDVITLEYGFALPKRDRIKGKFPVVGANGIDGYHNEYMIESPAVIVGRKGSAGKVNWIDENCTPIDTTFYVKTKPEKVILKFIYYVLKFSNLEKLSSGIGTPGLKRDDAYNVQIHVPEITKQKKIIAEVEELEVKIKSSESYLKSSKDLKQSILDKYLK